MWTKRVYSDSYLTSRPARSAGRTASFNFTTPVASEKCASSVCIKTGVSKGGGNMRKRVVWQKWDSHKISQQYSWLPVRGGLFSPGLQWLPHSSVFKSILCLTSHHRQLMQKKKAQIFSQGRGSRRQEQDVQLPHSWSVWGNTTTLLSLWVCLFCYYGS